jgi:hypothetical protein
MTRANWQNDTRSAQVVDLMLLLNDNPTTPRSHWRTGVVCEVYPDKKGHVPSVKLRTLVKKKNQEEKEPTYYVRPVAKCILLSAADQAPGRVG